MYSFALFRIGWRRGKSRRQEALKRGWGWLVRHEQVQPWESTQPVAVGDSEAGGPLRPFSKLWLVAEGRWRLSKQPHVHGTGQSLRDLSLRWPMFDGQSALLPSNQEGTLRITLMKTIMRRCCQVQASRAVGHVNGRTMCLGSPMDCPFKLCL